MQSDLETGQRAFEFVEAVSSMKTPEQVARRFGQEMERVGLERWLITGLPTVVDKIRPFNVISGWSEEWTTLYDDEGFVLVDPIVAESRRKAMPFRWSEAPVNPDHSRAKTVMDMAADAGMKEGFVVPIHLGATLSIVSAAGDRPEMSSESLPALHMMSLYAFEKAIDLFDVGLRRPSLSSREKDVLTWVAHGKTDWEISKILSVSESTVDRNLRSAAKKLCATNRTATAVTAIIRKEISI